MCCTEQISVDYNYYKFEITKCLPLDVKHVHRDIIDHFRHFQSQARMCQCFVFAVNIFVIVLHHKYLTAII